MLVDDLAEKTFVFKVKWQPRWKSCSVVCYKEGEAFVDQVVAKFPIVVVIGLSVLLLLPIIPFVLKFICNAQQSYEFLQYLSAC
jgi:hypothetical protein